MFGNRQVFLKSLRIFAAPAMTARDRHDIHSSNMPTAQRSTPHPQLSLQIRGAFAFGKGWKEP